MSEKVDRIGQIEYRIYDLGTRWLFAPDITRPIIEATGIQLADERTSLLAELTQEERDLYYASIPA